MADPSGLGDELKAALAARKELGGDYETALVQSFLDKVDAEVDARVAERLGTAQVAERRSVAQRGAVQRSGRSTPLALGSITLGIPVSAIITTQMHGPLGFLGLAAAWAAIAVVNVAHTGRRS